MEQTLENTLFFALSQYKAFLLTWAVADLRRRPEEAMAPPEGGKSN